VVIFKRKFTTESSVELYLREVMVRGGSARKVETVQRGHWAMNSRVKGTCKFKTSSLEIAFICGMHG